MRILANDVKNHIGNIITIKGWVHRIRELGKVSFVILRDRTGIVQVVFDDKCQFTNESVLAITGPVRENEKAPTNVEIHAAEVDVLAPANPEIPIPVNQDPENLGIDAILDNRMISLRIPKIRSIFTLQANILKYFSEYMNAHDFTEIKTSKLIGSGTEGGTGLFKVAYFDTNVFLAQSPQFYKQAMVASGMERVYEIGAAYRAEKHDTPRHLNEYVSLDVEMAFIEDEIDLIQIERELLAFIFEKIKTNNANDLEAWGATVPDPEAINKSPILSHDEAKKIISSEIGRRIFEINPEGERVICEWSQREHGVDMVYINAYPRKKRPFYTYPDGMKTKSFDCIFRGLEITTGGRRINEYNMLKEALPKFGMTEKGLGQYIDIFKYGCPPHGGFAIGLERITQQVLGLSNVKAASIFPRDRKRITP